MVTSIHNLLHSKDKLLTSEEAAEQLGVTLSTLCVWRSTKRYPLPYIKVGRLVRYRVEDLEDFLQQRMRNITHNNKEELY